MKDKLDEIKAVIKAVKKEELSEMLKSSVEVYVTAFKAVADNADDLAEVIVSEKEAVINGITHLTLGVEALTPLVLKFNEVTEKLGERIAPTMTAPMKKMEELAVKIEERAKKEEDSPPSNSLN